ncbi:putative efflux protein, MATE family [Sarcina sp. DSM 11001]|uniref:MATE family efflux transporter n=1 Tax=Sarcina sp. DSM 11001 TaxID=1798184 RepID=UPI00088DC701|nr:MATE family efflux transporter [Sarcina sp. DSM 11001]SDL72502.1 putative efflux protein, MATE family [Sarcina sp. DSM 11001]
MDKTDQTRTNKTLSGNPITEGVIWRQILLYFFPLLLSSFFQQLYNTADAMIVGQAAGKQALSAVGGSAGSVVGIFIMFYIGFSGGAAVLAAQFFGAENSTALQSSIRKSLSLSFLMGLAGTLVCFFFASSILTVMNTPADIMAPSLWYLKIAAFGMLPNSLYNMGASILRAVGDVRRPLFILIFTCLSNIGLDLLFVASLGMGASGAALATVLCQFLSACLVLWFLRPFLAGGRRILFTKVISKTGKPMEEIHHRHSRSPENLTGRILQMGLPLGFSEVMYTFANVVLMSVVNGFGTDTVAAYAAYGKIDAIFWMIVGSFGVAITTFVGQNIGAGRWDRVMQSIRDCALMMFLTLGIVIALLYTGAEFMQSLFITDPDVILIGVRMMHFLMPFYFLYIPIEILFGALRGMGDSLLPTLITFFGVCVLRSAWGIFIVPLHHTVNMVLLGFPVTWIVSDLAFAVYFYWYVQRNKPDKS